LIIPGIGFIQIESVKSVVKNQGLGFGWGSAAVGVSWANKSKFPASPRLRRGKPGFELKIRKAPRAVTVAAYTSGLAPLRFRG